MTNSRYFRQEEGDPLPLKVSVSRRVRFEEVDSLGLVWHGRYVSYFEDGRVAFGDKYGLSYVRFKKENVAAPIVKLHIDFKAPLFFDEVMEIQAQLCWSEAMRLNFEYRITGPGGRLVAEGYTVQLLTDAKGGLLLIAPDWVEEFRRKWKAGELV